MYESPELYDMMLLSESRFDVALGGPVRFAGLNQFSAPVYVRD